MKFSEIAGWIGVTLILLAYILATLGGITTTNLLYGCMNLVGASGIMISSYKKRDFQPVFLNSIWLLVAIVAVVRSLR